LKGASKSCGRFDSCRDEQLSVDDKQSVRMQVAQRASNRSSRQRHVDVQHAVACGQYLGNARSGSDASGKGNLGEGTHGWTFIGMEPCNGTGRVTREV
jgi:hypothetical protein